MANKEVNQAAKEWAEWENNPDGRYSMADAIVDSHPDMLDWSEEEIELFIKAHNEEWTKLFRAAYQSCKEEQP